MSNKRLLYITKVFRVFDEETDTNNVVDDLKSMGFTITKVETILDKQNMSRIAWIVYERVKTTLSGKMITKRYVDFSSYVLELIVKADPSTTFQFSQWMMHCLKKEIIHGDIRSEEYAEALRFITEDLSAVSENLRVFMENHLKHRFSTLGASSETLQGVDNFKDIFQYKSIKELSEVVDPFIVRDASGIYKSMMSFVNRKAAEIPVRDDKFLVYIPKTKEAAAIFENLVDWCTSKYTNSNFESYRNQLTPDKKNSELYIIVPLSYLDNKSDDIYQIHFESKQVRDRLNREVDISNKVFDLSPTIGLYFKDILITYAKMVNNINNNPYIDYLLSFGFGESVFEFLDVNSKIIELRNKPYRNIPDISDFRELELLLIMNSEIKEIHPSIYNLSKLRMLSLDQNNITVIPSGIEKLKNLVLLNLQNNKIEHIPDSISELDKTKGGSLTRLVIRDANPSVKERVKKLLPSVEVV